MHVDEVAEHVNVALVVHRGHFNAGNQSKSGRARCCRRLVEAGDGVVIGNADRCQPGGRGAADQFGWRQPAVRGGGMEMEIDHSKTGIFTWRAAPFSARRGNRSAFCSLSYGRGRAAGG